MTMFLSRSVMLALVVGLWAGSAGAAGRKTPTKATLEEAQSRYQRGRELYDENDFQAALVEFQRAYELAPSYRLLFNIAQVQYQLQDYANALGSFQQYLQEGEAELSGPRREEVQREIDRLEVRVARVRITVNKPGAEISVDDVPVGTAPLREPLLVNAGRRKVSVSLTGHVPVSRVVNVAGRDSIEVSLELVSTSAPVAAAPSPAASSLPPMPPPPQTRGSGATAEVAGSDAPRGASWVPWAATGGLAVASGVSALLTLNASNALREKRDTFGVSRGDLDAASSRTRTMALTTDVLTGATVVAAGISAYLTFLRPSPAPTAPERVRVGVGPGGVDVSGSF
ncbi:PEGA domain-containing protein [Vitiosangium sp. GDMCC 1.1324]|uniref:PEGA domain-containing protein n=1 Tax=Vitiosangium sp. (strain GDMCC 1.1324) TaxID=2138576 RepID=UPI00130DF2B6|nr:PEGA domain-containing protein [Vitiosangium sp. GDMCC 1.1324]